MYNFSKLLTFLSILIIVLAVQSISAQDGARSIYLNYQENAQGYLIRNSVQASDPSPQNTYHASMVWPGVNGDAGGYCGIQEHPAGRNFIFSLWDPANSMEAITADYVGPGTQVDPFGGEGTGLRSINYQIGWNTGEWWTTCARSWNYNNRTYFGFWIQNEATNQWYHLVTMIYPLPNLNFGNSTSSFIEDWVMTGQNQRRGNYKNGWKRQLDHTWKAFDQAQYDVLSPDPRTANYANNVNGGVENGAYFMQTGGTTASSIADLTLLQLPSPTTSPVLSIGEILCMDLTYNSGLGQLTVGWNTNEFVSPQYSYTIEVYDNPAHTGIPIATSTDVVPHRRSVNLNVGMTNAPLYVKMHIMDIFDQKSQDFTNYIDISRGNSYQQCTNASAAGTIDNLLKITDDEYCQISNLGLNAATTITMSAWIKPTGNQADFTGILINDGTGSTGESGLMIRNNKLAYFWPGGNFGWDSGLVVPPDVWSHVAMVVQPTGATLYLNGVPSTHTTTLTASNFDAAKIGSYRGWGGRYFIGEIDEVAIYNSALTTDQIRDTRHIYKSAGVGLLHYYQFNEVMGNAIDGIGTSNGTLQNGATRIATSAPIGSGISHRLNITSGGSYPFTGTDLTLQFPPAGTYPNGDIVVSKLNRAPNFNPFNVLIPKSSYWIIDNYGANTTFSQLIDVTLDGLTDLGPSANNYNLYQRSENAHLNNWTLKDQADNVIANSLLFSISNGITTSGQLAIGTACQSSYSKANNNRLTHLQMQSFDYETNGIIESSQIIRNHPSNPAMNLTFDYDSGNSILFFPGFEARLGVIMNSFIDGCGGSQ